MKKSIIAAAIAATIAAPAANAGVVLYGKVHVSIDYTDYSFLDDGGWGDTGSDDAWFVQSRASRIGFKGTEDLGNGLKAIWKAETGYDFADGKQWNAARNAYIGLAGDWGTFLYGRHDTPYKIAFYSTGIEMAGDTIMDLNQSMRWDGNIGEYTDSLSVPYGFEEVRASNAIAYISPNMNGLTVAAAMMPGEGTKKGNGLADFYSVSAMYSNNGLNLAAAYEDMEGDTGLEDNKWLVGGSYTMNNLTVALAYAEHTDAAYDMEKKNLAVAASYKFGNNKLVVNWMDVDIKETNLEPWGNPSISDSGEGNQWGIGLMHSFSKRTTGYVAYSSADFTVGGPGDDIYLGGTGTDMGYDDGSADTDSFSIGLIHNF